MTARLRRGLPYRWWTTDAGTLTLTVLLVSPVLLVLGLAWFGWPL